MRASNDDGVDGWTFRADVHDVIANDERRLAWHLATGEGESRTLEDREVLVFHLRDIKVVTP